MNEQDRQYVQLLSVFHYVVGALAGLFACFPVIHLVLGILMFTGRLGGASARPELRIIGLFFAGIASIFILSGWTFAILLVLAGRYLQHQAHYTFCLVMAGIACIFFPFGTVLGVFTIVVLSKPAVRESFGQVGERSG